MRKTEWEWKSWEEWEAWEEWTRFGEEIRIMSRIKIRNYAGQLLIRRKKWLAGVMGNVALLVGPLVVRG